MSRLDQQPEIVQMASELGLDTESNAVEQIAAFCRRRIEGWLREANLVPDTMPQIEEIVRKQLRLVFEEVWSDGDLQRIVGKYTSMGEFVFATLIDDLDENTFATLMERKHATGASEDRYVAVIDCRGDKEARRFFTKWHEIAHLLTLIRQLELPFHRSTTDKSPTERLMDAIAGEVGFYDPILRPALAAELRAAGKLTFEGVERIRNSVFLEASFRATLNACAARAAVPVVVVEAGMGLKKQERETIESRQLTLIPIPPPEPQLRALVAIGNDAAKRKGLRIDQNMRVPEKSLVYRHYKAEDPVQAAFDLTESERLDIWRHSDGSPVGSGLIEIQTRRVKDRVLALIQLAPEQRVHSANHTPLMFGQGEGGRMR